MWTEWFAKVINQFVWYVLGIGIAIGVSIGFVIWAIVHYCL